MIKIERQPTSEQSGGAQKGLVGRLVEGLRKTRLGHWLLGPTSQELTERQERQRVQYELLLQREKNEKEAYEHGEKAKDLAHFQRVLENYTSGVSPLEPLYGWETPKVIDAIRARSPELGVYTGLGARKVVEALLLDVETVLRYVVGDTSAEDLPKAFSPVDKGTRPYVYYPSYMREKEPLSGESMARFLREPKAFLTTARASLSRAAEELATAESGLRAGSYPDLHERMSRYEKRLTELEAGKDPKAAVMMELIGAFKKMSAGQRSSRFSAPGAESLLASLKEAEQTGADRASIDVLRERLLERIKNDAYANSPVLIDTSEGWFSEEEKVQASFETLRELRFVFQEPDTSSEQFLLEKLREFQQAGEEEESITEMIRELEQWGTT